MTYFILNKDGTTEEIKHAYPFEYKGIGLFAHLRNKDWQVCEVLTGILIVYGFTDTETIQCAKETIDRLGVDNVKERIRNRLNQRVTTKIENVTTI